MNKVDLNAVLELHKLWTQNDPKGKRANLSGANLSGAYLSCADLSRADLSCADLSRADLYGVNLSDANLRGADLFSANLSSANLSGANLSRADLYGANLSGANLSGANTQETELEGKQILEFQFEKHKAHYRGLDFIQIGCRKLSIQYWINNLDQIGIAESYTQSQIEAYKRFILLCKNEYELSRK